MNKVLCISGMHRSGTSLTASWIESCGLSIHGGKLIGAIRSNPKGHFEDKDFVDLHSSMIRQISPESDGWKIFPNDFIYFNNKHLTKAMALTHARNSKYLFWGWKDPRTILFLKQWKSIIPEMKALLIWRPCDQVIQSLIVRAKIANLNEKVLKITPWEAFQLWRKTNELILRYKENYPEDTILVSINNLLEFDNALVNMINGKFGFTLQYNPILNLYDKDLFNKSRRFPYLNFLNRLSKFTKIEEKLKKMSDLNIK